jgi:hypothetical protein
MNSPSARPAAPPHPKPWRIEYYANHKNGCKILDANGHWVCSVENSPEHWIADFIVACVNSRAESAPQEAGTRTFREWLCQGGGGFEDGEDGIRACTMPMSHVIDLVDEYLWAERGVPLEEMKNE